MWKDLYQCCGANVTKAGRRCGLGKKYPQSAVQDLDHCLRAPQPSVPGLWFLTQSSQDKVLKNSHERFLRGNTALTRKERSLAFLKN